MAEKPNVEVVNLAPHLSNDKVVQIGQLVGAQLRMNNATIEIALVVHTVMELAGIDPEMEVNLKDYEEILMRNAANSGIPCRIIKKEVPTPTTGQQKGH